MPRPSLPQTLRLPNLLPRHFSTTPTRPLAKISILGRLAAEPELHATSTGQDLIRYAVGTSSGPRENRQTSWWRVAAFTPEGPARDALVALGKG
ncbi:MAG: hypothetical protein Q9181_008104, partial [Wetmoreana brouardii]